MTQVSPLLVLQARAEARALLFQAAEYADVDEAIGPLLKYALDHGIVDQIGADRTFAIIKTAFAGAVE